MFKFVFFAILLIGMLQVASADELRPAYIELTEIQSGEWSVIWKASARAKLGQTGQLVLPNNCTQNAELTSRKEGDNLKHSTTIKCSGAIENRKIGLSGLENTNTDALVRIMALDQDTQVIRLTPKNNIVSIPVVQQNAINNVGLTYTWIGVEHIVFGYDHLFFVLLLVFLLTGWKRIAWTITAFTVAHSITLIGTTLNLFALPSKPVEAIIALSIVFLAIEVIRSKPDHLRLSERYPWLVAFIFGLLHGFGFAGALAEIGLPEQDIALALLSFNLGVEVGQLAIVFTALLLLFLIRKRFPSQVRLSILLPTYLIGSISMFWLFNRL